MFIVLHFCFVTGNEKKKCKCGADNCSGFLGVKPKTQNAMSIAEKAQKKKEKEKERRKQKRMKKQKITKKGLSTYFILHKNPFFVNIELLYYSRTFSPNFLYSFSVHEDECFHCKDGGDLILCSRVTCTKSYHLKCLSLDKKPYGKWECPWHFCDSCGKSAKFMCSLCANSYCVKHQEGELFPLRDAIMVCSDHSEEEFTSFLAALEAKLNADDVIPEGTNVNEVAVAKEEDSSCKTFKKKSKQDKSAIIDRVQKRRKKSPSKLLKKAKK